MSFHDCKLKDGVHPLSLLWKGPAVAILLVNPAWASNGRGARHMNSPIVQRATPKTGSVTVHLMRPPARPRPTQEEELIF